MPSRIYFLLPRREAEAERQAALRNANEPAIKRPRVQQGSPRRGSAPTDRQPGLCSSNSLQECPNARRPPRSSYLHAGCPYYCRYKCHSKISEEGRRHIFRQFWGLADHTRQWDFLNKHTTVLPTCSLEKGNNSSKTPIFRKHYFQEKGTRVRHCWKIFLSTLDISESWLKTAHAKLCLGHVISPDKRGKNSKVKPELRASQEENIKTHIKMLKCVPSHFCRARTK